MDPRLPGGAGAVNRWYRRWMEIHRPNLAAVFFDELAGSGDFARRALRWRIEEGNVPRLWPRLHVPQYYAGRFILRRQNVAVEEVHTVGPHVAHGWVMRDADVPNLVWFCTTLGDERRRVLQHHDRLRRAMYRATLRHLERLESEVLRRAHRVLAMSPYTVELMIGLGIPSNRVEIVPIPIDTDLFHPDHQQPKGGVLFVGRVRDPRKNFAAVVRLLEASDLVRERGLDVISDEDPRIGMSRIAALATRWHERTDDVAANFRRAEVLVLTSWQEGFGLVVFEALASGTPVVAYRCGGPDGYLEASGGGFLVETGSGLKTRVEQLLKDPALREDMGQAGRGWVETNMSAKDFLTNDSLFTVGPR